MILNEKSELLYVSDSIYRVTGYMAQEIAGVSTLTFVHPEDLPLLQEVMVGVLTNPGKSHNHTYRRRRKDGSYIWCEGTGTNLLHEPAVQGIVINFRDITERMEAELALKESEYKFRSLIKHSSDAITVVNERFEVIFASDSLAAITGFSPEDVKGMTFADFAHPEDLEEVKAYFNDLLHSHAESKKIVYRSRRKDGVYIWVERVAVNWLADPLINGIVSNYRDVTDRRKYLEAIQASNVSLTKSNQELDRFVYSVSHDLRAPLASVLGILNIIDAEKSAPLIAEELGLIKDSVEKLDGFILDILDYSKNSRLVLKRQPINFKESVDVIVNNLKYMSDGAANTTIKSNVTGSDIFYSDQSRINIVLNNLISNAVRYHDIEKQQHIIEVSAYVTPENARIIISDNGIGIPNDKHEQIFEMFYRLSKKSVGSGLGLYIVKETVEKLNGVISLESTPQKGTAITVLIPNMINEQ
jgi:PAS domain S-box-containing protein